MQSTFYGLHWYKWRFPPNCWKKLIFSSTVKGSQCAKLASVKISKNQRQHAVSVLLAYKSTSSRTNYLVTTFTIHSKHICVVSDLILSQDLCHLYLRNYLSIYPMIYHLQHQNNKSCLKESTIPCLLKYR